jgi:hypothetical protein
MLNRHSEKIMEFFINNIFYAILLGVLIAIIIQFI